MEEKTFSRRTHVFLAKVSESCERHKYMVYHMKCAVNMCDDVEFSIEERNLLSVAYKNMIGPKRATLRIISIAKCKESPQEKELLQALGFYSRKVEEETRNLVEDVIQVTDKLIERCQGVEAKVFFYKMQGDYYRYLAEFEKGESKTSAARNSRLKYKRAYQLSSELSYPHPVRLGLVLNFSVYYYEIAEKKTKACEFAKKEVEKASECIKDADKDSKLILQLITDNLSLWRENEIEDNEIPKEN